MGKEWHFRLSCPENREENVKAWGARESAHKTGTGIRGNVGRATKTVQKITDLSLAVLIPTALKYDGL